MRKAAIAAFMVAAMAMATPRLTAQEKTKNEATATDAPSGSTTLLKMAVTLTEFEGDKKVKSLPYSMVVVADEKPPKSILKVGSRVPVYVGKEYGMQYLDIGTNIDCQASRTNDNRFDVRLSLERSWVEGDVPVTVDPTTASQQSSGQFREPIVRQFKSELNLTLHDGQTIESSFATDPLSGKVFKVEASLNVMK